MPRTSLLLLLLFGGPPCLAQEEAPLTPSEIERLSEEASQAEAGEIASEDAALEERLRSILSAVDSFAGVDAEVSAGVVVLDGTAGTSEAADEAAAMAEKLPGALLVLNEIEVEKGLEVRLRSAWDAVGDRLRAALGSLPLVGVAIVVVLLFWFVARLLRDADILYRVVRGRTLLQNLLRQTVFGVVLALGLVAGLRLMDATAVIGTALGAAGVVGLALGFAFRNIVENYLAGILLAIRQPFRARDLVDIDGTTGTVLRMTSSETTLMDADGNHMRLPNAMVFNGKVLNYTRNPLRRFTVTVGVGTAVDLDRAQELGVETLRRMKGVVDDPAPSAIVAALGDSTVQIDLHGWVDQREASFTKVASEAHRLIKARYDEADIEMPSPEYNVVLDAPPQLPERREPAPQAVDAGTPPEEIDVSVGDAVTDQVEAELARSDEPDLLSEER